MLFRSVHTSTRFSQRFPSVDSIITEGKPLIAFTPYPHSLVPSHLILGIKKNLSLCLSRCLGTDLLKDLLLHLSDTHLSVCSDLVTCHMQSTLNLKQHVVKTHCL